jgi:hypothetical protein
VWGSSVSWDGVKGWRVLTRVPGRDDEGSRGKEKRWETATEGHERGMHRREHKEKWGCLGKEGGQRVDSTRSIRVQAMDTLKLNPFLFGTPLTRSTKTQDPGRKRLGEDPAARVIITGIGWGIGEDGAKLLSPCSSSAESRARRVQVFNRGVWDGSIVSLR